MQTMPTVEQPTRDVTFEIERPELRSTSRVGSWTFAVVALLIVAALIVWAIAVPEEVAEVHDSWMNVPVSPVSEVHDSWMAVAPPVAPEVHDSWMTVTS